MIFVMKGRSSRETLLVAWNGFSNNHVIEKEETVVILQFVYGETRRVFR